MARSAWKGFAAGAIGGTVGTKAFEDRLSTGQTYTKQQEELLHGFEKAHTQTAEAVASAAGVTLSSSQKKHAPPGTEYAFGILCGGIYGLIAEYVPQATAGFRTAYGAVLFTGTNDIVLSRSRMVPIPQDRTPIQHLGGFSGNVVYGGITEAVRRLLR